MRFDAVVLAGGAARRFGDDKVSATVGGRRLLDRVLDAVSGAGTIVVVGPPRHVATERSLRWVREEPPGGGPAAGLARGLVALPGPAAGDGAGPPPDAVVVLAGDLPFVAEATVLRLLTALESGGGDGAVLTDDIGQPQWLVGAWRLTAVAGCGLEPGASLRGTLGRLSVALVPAIGGEALDCDVPADIVQARLMAGEDSGQRVAPEASRRPGLIAPRGQEMA